MKKLLAVLLAALLLAAPAFAQTASLAGEWTMTKTVASGVVMSPEAYGLSMTIVLNPDGTAFARQTINGAPMEENGTWTQAGNTVTITSQLTGEVSTFTLQSDGTLLWNDFPWPEKGRKYGVWKLFDEEGNVKEERYD